MKSVLITGGSSGIGEALVRAARRQGWTLFIGYHCGAEKAALLAGEANAAGTQAFPIHLDLHSIQTLERDLESLAKVSTSLDALVLCAAPAPVLKIFTKLTADDLLAPLTAGVIASHAIITWCWKRFFEKASGGHIIGVLSEAMGPPPWPQMADYIVAKRGLQGLLECAAVDLGRRGMRVSAISPHYTETPMLTRLHPHIVEAARAKVPAHRFLTPEEVAAKILHQLENPPEPGRFVLERIPAHPA